MNFSGSNAMQLVFITWYPS